MTRMTPNGITMDDDVTKFFWSTLRPDCEGMNSRSGTGLIEMFINLGHVLDEVE